MRIGVPKEIKQDEYRVSIVPAGVETLVNSGHSVAIQKGAGIGSGITDEDFEKAGARIVSLKSIWADNDIIIKVKEPLPREFKLIRPRLILFTYFHFAVNKKLIQAMQKAKAVCIAYETIEDNMGRLPLLTAMSEVAGRLSVQEGAKFLENPTSGRGILLSGIPGVAPANVIILGGGVVGSNAAKVAAGLGARVTILDVNLNRLRYLDDIMPSNVRTIMSDSHSIRFNIQEADLVIGAVLITGSVAPNLITRDMLKLMKPGSVIVDVAIDQGGCTETSRVTTHKNPIFIVNDVVHYCVANMPGAVGRTSTYGLTNSTLPYLHKIANLGYKKAIALDPGFAKGLNVIEGKITYEAVATAFGLKYTPVDKVV